MVQIIYIESSGKTRSPLRGQYLSALIAQRRLARCLVSGKSRNENANEINHDLLRANTLI